MTLHVLACTIALASILGGGNKPVDNKHFLIYGKTLELDLIQGMAPIPTEGVQVIIYQDDDIYAAFDSESMGEYAFNLPIGYEYKIVYGGEGLVSKNIVINSRTLAKSRTGHAVEVDMALFKEIEHADLEVFNEPAAIFYCDQQLKTLVPDPEYGSDQSKKMKKAVKKAVKQLK